jgi:hypothetical protein
MSRLGPLPAFLGLYAAMFTTQELLDLIVDKIQYAPVLALMTFRPEYQPRWVGQPHVSLMALNRLTRRQCAEMARHVVARAALPASALDAIVQRTDGIPLFVEELTRALLEGGISETIPTTIQASLSARLDRLGTAKQVAQIGAVIGREFDHTLLASVSPIGGQELDNALGRLIGSELVFRRGVPPDATYTFKHALVQDAAYESLLKVPSSSVVGAASPLGCAAILRSPVCCCTPAGKAMFQMLGVFAEFERAMIRERVNAGLARARAQGTRSGRAIGRPATAMAKADRVLALRAKGLTTQAIADKLGIGKTSVLRLLGGLPRRGIQGRTLTHYGPS